MILETIRKRDSRMIRQETLPAGQNRNEEAEHDHADVDSLCF